jgi:acyl-CoA reductase-like NAD-dependent aldehyde dehydrogenase
MQAVFKIAAAFAFGNSVVLKPSEHSSLTCLSMADLCKDILEPG